MKPTSNRITLVLPFLLFGVAGCGSMVMAQSAGTFMATGNMTTTRLYHTATLLADGKVLIAGGSLEPSAELYDPGTGTFTATGNMTRPRVGHSATLLPDGRVFIVGGCGPLSCYPVGSEVYDPSTGTFTESANLVLPPVAVTLLPSGQLLLSGFVPSVGAFQKLYDPATGALTPAAAVIPDSIPGLATLLANGKVLFTFHQGASSSNPVVGAGKLYDPAAHTFSPADDLDYYTATLLMNGTVLFVGDPNDDYGSIKTAYLYDPSTGKFTTTGNTTMRGAATSGTATLLPDGTVLIVPSAELYDPVIGSFSATGSMITVRFSPRATLLNNGQVLITGGWVPGVGPLAPLPHPPYPLASAELYTPRVLVPAPVLFSLSGDGRGQGAILHPGTARVVSPSDPAVAGEVLEIYGNGLLDGSVIPPEVAIGGRMAEILFFGKAPGFADLNQVNVRVPGGTASGPAVGVRLTYLGRPSKEVTIGVQ